MAGTVTITEKLFPSVKKLTFTWTSCSSGGDATGTTTNRLDGDIIGFGTVPDGTAAPSADYDITIADSDSLDVLFGAGIDRSATATEYVTRTSLGAVSDSKLTFTVENAGNSKKGVAVLYIR